jgi:hypothetical protein
MAMKEKESKKAGNVGGGDLSQETLGIETHQKP